MKASPLLIGLLALLAAQACARERTDGAPISHPREGNPSRCFEETGSSCGAGQLPRIAPGDWSEQQVGEFMGRFPAGTVAVALAAGRWNLEDRCKLDGAYTELNGTSDSARLWVSNRLLLLPSEIGKDCDEATHLVAAFVVRDSTFSAVAVPLPCPFIAETTPAERCIGKGATGAERANRVKEAIQALPPATRWGQDPAFVLENYSLAPDHWLALQLLARLETECALSEQARWLVSRYTITRDAGGERSAVLAPDRLPPHEPAPRLDSELSSMSCLHQPAFRKCFQGLFEPSTGAGECWEPATRESGLR